MKRSQWETQPTQGQYSGAAILKSMGEAARIWRGVADLQDAIIDQAQVYDREADVALNAIVAAIVTHPGSHIHTNLAGVEARLSTSDEEAVRRGKVASHLADYLRGLERGTDSFGVQGDRFALTVRKSGLVLSQRLDWSRAQGLHNIASGEATNLMPLEPGDEVQGMIVRIGSIPPAGGALIAHGRWRHTALAHLVEEVSGEPQVDLEIFARRS